ncbi:MAG TPA: HAMP domain-containing protein, partial [Aggregicoccus sp.]|nr:HAMP domain-containing protein [Aggregicoccus sp.]
MRRLLPGSLARQTGLVLALGMGAVLLLGLAVSSLRILREVRLQGERDEVDRLVPFAVALDVAPPELRARLYAAAARLGVRATEHPPRATPAALHDDWYTRRLRLRLAHELAAYGKVRAVAVGHPQPASRLEGHGPTVARLALSDGTTVDVALPGGFSPLGFLGETGPMVLVLGGGLIVLAVLVSRRVTRPLGDFASAAVRLGRDVNAPPLPEQGPSELRAVARAFNQMQQRLARLLEDRRHLLSAVSHDLRTPITRLRLRAEFIEDEAQRARTLDDLAEMEAMIASVLSLARDESVREPRAPLDLTGMVTQLCEELRELGHAVELAPAPPLRVTARPLALKRALRNLVENAAKYGGRAQL